MNLQKDSTTPPHWRILIVDNEERTRQEHYQNLQDERYDIFLAVGEGQALLADAEDKARTHRCHLALVDMRLLDDSDRTDTSGLDLVEKLKPAESIIVTGFADKARFGEEARKKGALHILDKDAGPAALRDMVRSTLRECGFRDVAISLPPELGPMPVARHIFSENPALFDEAVDVLRRLFPEARSLQVAPLDPGYSTSSLAVRPRSLMLRVRQDDQVQPYFVRIGRKLKVEQEVSNFNRIKSGFGYSPYLTLRPNPVALWILGGICYELIGNDSSVSPFSQYYATHELSDVRRILGELALFWRPLYQLGRGQLNPPDDSVFEAYSKVWGTDWHHRLLETAQHHKPDLPEPYRRFNLPDSISWVIQQVKLTGTGKYDLGRTPRIDVAMTHGDLHSDNIFVNARDKVCVVDFDRTGYGPALRDYVELETDILTRLVTLTIDMPALWELYLAVVIPLDSEHPMDASERLLRHPETRKAFYAVNELRQQALKSVGYFDQQAYLWSMLLEVVFTQLITIRGQFYQDATFSRLRLLGSIICHRLDSWNRQWPPKEWQYAADELPGIKWMSEAEQKARANYVEYLRNRLKDVVTESEQMQREQRNSRDLLDRKRQIEEQLRAFGEEP